MGPKENDWDERVQECVKDALCLMEYDKVLCVWSVQVARGAVDHTTNAVHEDLSLLVWCFYFYIAPDFLFFFDFVSRHKRPSDNFSPERDGSVCPVSAQFQLFAFEQLRAARAR